jgi:hypothetical protein
VERSAVLPNRRLQFTSTQTGLRHSIVRTLRPSLATVLMQTSGVLHVFPVGPLHNEGQGNQESDPAAHAPESVLEAEYPGLLRHLLRELRQRFLRSFYLTEPGLMKFCVIPSSSRMKNGLLFCAWDINVVCTWPELKGGAVRRRRLRRPYLSMRKDMPFGMPSFPTLSIGITSVLMPAVTLVTMQLTP